MKNKTNIMNIFEEKRKTNSYVKISAPMVRYSKLAFRTLLRNYNVDICYCPMIIADSFCKSANARNSEFSTNLCDTPLIVQFAANDSIKMLKAAQLVYPYSDGVDLNCGCPQKWAIGEGYGCYLLKKPEIIYDIMKTLRRNLPSTFTCSIKLRLLEKNVQETINLCRQIEMCGVNFLTIHGRTPWQKSSEDIDINSLVDIKKSLSIPIIANGNVKTLNDAEQLYQKTKCDGIMAARGLLSNPQLFTGITETSINCIQNWLDTIFATNDKTNFQCLHHHLTFMMSRMLKKKERIIFNNFTQRQQIYDFLLNKFNITPNTGKTSYNMNNLNCCYNDVINCYNNIIYNSRHLDNISGTNGKYFNEFFHGDSMQIDENTSIFGMMGKSLFDT